MIGTRIIEDVDGFFNFFAYMPLKGVVIRVHQMTTSPFLVQGNSQGLLPRQYENIPTTGSV